MANTLSFITSNPATDAFDRGQATALAQEQAERAGEAQMLQNAESLAAAPSKLRTVKANADTAVATADVAKGTVGSRIATSGATARTAGANARVAEGTVDSRISAQEAAARAAGANADVAQGTVQPRIDTAVAGAQTAQAGARTAGATADVAQGTVQPRIDTAVAQRRLATVNADIGERTADSTVQTAQAGARSATARAAAAEMEGFYKSLDLLNAGDPASAQYVAQQYGSAIPDAVVNDAGLRKEITDAANYAKTTYPNRPKDQQLYMQGYIKTRLERMATAKSQGEPAQQASPTDIYTVPGAPTPPDLSTTSQQHAPADIQTAEWLVANGVAGNAQEAWQLVKQSRANPQTIYASVFNTALRTSFGDRAKAKKTADEFMLMLNNSGAAAPAAPAAQPAPAPAQAPTAAAPGPVGLQPPPGRGSPEAPYQATTQAHVDWFKQSARSGQVIVINGQPYTK